MLNCPGRPRGSASRTGSSTSVTESCVSTRRDATRYGRGSIESRSALATITTVTALAAVTRAPVEVEEPGPAGLQAQQQRLEEAEREGVSQSRVLGCEGAEADGVELERLDGGLGDGGVVPVVRRYEPG